MVNQQSNETSDIWFVVVCCKWGYYFHFRDCNIWKLAAGTIISGQLVKALCKMPYLRYGKFTQM